MKHFPPQYVIYYYPTYANISALVQFNLFFCVIVYLELGQNNSCLFRERKVPTSFGHNRINVKNNKQKEDCIKKQ
jgi:hypothetical protein